MLRTPDLQRIAVAKRSRQAVIDLGSGNVTCMLGEMANDGVVRIVGFGRIPADGWVRGTTADLERAIGPVVSAWKSATWNAGVHRKDVYASVHGEHCWSVRGRGSVAVRNPRRGISMADVRGAIEQALAIALPSNQEILHVIPTGYVVDGQKYIAEPRGLFGYRLDVEVQIVVCRASVVENISRVLGMAGLRLRGTLLRGIAAALGATSRQEREIGVALIYLGAQTELLVLKGSSVLYHAALELGGGVITNDVSALLRLPYQVGERLKIGRGVALVSRVTGDELLQVQLPNNIRRVSRHLLASIVESRVDELLTLVLAQLSKNNLVEQLAAGVVITGSTAQLPGIDELGEQVLNLPVRVGLPCGVLGPQEVLRDPSWVPGVGLLRLALCTEMD
jgi:cell division protein FtsA